MKSRRAKNFSTVLFFWKYLFIYLTMWGLSCSTQNLLGDLLWHEGSFSCSIWTLWQHVGSSSLTMDQTPAPLHWECEVLATWPPGKSLRPYCRWDDFFFLALSFVRIRIWDVALYRQWVYLKQRGASPAQLTWVRREDPPVGGEARVQGATPLGGSDSASWLSLSLHFSRVFSPYPRHNHH